MAVLPEPISILFVCHGNICRSPMAEFIMKDLVAKAKLADQFHIESAATSAEELGNPVYPGTKKILTRLGIDCSQKRARRITLDDYKAFDLIIGMDDANVRNLRMKYHNDPDNKIHLLLDYTGEQRAIADPWYSGDFETTYQDVTAGCQALLASLTQEA